MFSTSISPSSIDLAKSEIAQHGEHVVALRLAVGVMRIAHMHDDVGFGDLFEGRAKRRDEMGRQIGDEADRIGQDRLAPGWQIEPPHRRVERREQHVLGADLSTGSTG